MRFALVALLGCTTATEETAVGPLGSSGPLALPAGVVRPDALDTFTLRADVCGWPEGGQAPAEVAVTVRSFVVGVDRYVSDYEVALTRSSPALQVTLDAPREPGGASLTPGAPWMGVALVSFDCLREDRVGCRSVSFRGADMVQVTADGRKH